MPKTLLDLDRIPTLDDLRAFFKENDFSAATYMDMNYEKLPYETVTDLGYAKKMLDEHFEPLSHEMGLKSHSSCYGKDNPLIAMRDNFENLVAGGVYKLLDEQPENAIEYLADFIDDNGDFTVNADDFLHNAVETAMKVMSYEETAKIVQDIPTYEDFNHDKHNNYRAADFDRKWNHTRAQTKTISLQNITEDNDIGTDIADHRADVTEEAIANIKQERFWCAITEEDKKLLRLRMDGLTQTEIANKLGYKTHSAVTKRLQRLKEIFENCA